MSTNVKSFLFQLWIDRGSRWQMSSLSHETNQTKLLVVVKPYRDNLFIGQRYHHWHCCEIFYVCFLFCGTEKWEKKCFDGASRVKWNAHAKLCRLSVLKCLKNGSGLKHWLDKCQMTNETGTCEAIWGFSRVVLMDETFLWTQLAKSMKAH